MAQDWLRASLRYLNRITKSGARSASAHTQPSSFRGSARARSAAYDAQTVSYWLRSYRACRQSAIRTRRIWGATVLGLAPRGYPDGTVYPYPPGESDSVPLVASDAKLGVSFRCNDRIGGESWCIASPPQVLRS
jgi:hypothetical protein